MAQNGGQNINTLKYVRSANKVAYVKCADLEMEWETGEEYQQCIELMETFKEHQAKIWEMRNEIE